jgi:putative spermidine/putrescine transport system permease protein
MPRTAEGLLPISEGDTRSGPRVARGAERPVSLWLGVPLAIVVACLLLWPLAVLAFNSLVSETDGVSFDNYATVLTSERYLTSFMITSVLAVGSTVLALLLCVPAALYIERTQSRASRGIAVALTIPLSLPGIVIGFFIILVFGNTGLVPVASNGLFGEPVGSIAYTFTGLLLGYLYFNIPRVILVVRGAVAQVPHDTLDAARTLGGSPWHVYQRVVIPALRPAIASASALSLATAFGAYGTAVTLSRGYRVVPLDIADAFTESFNPELAATLSVVLALVTTMILVGVSRLGEKGGRVG